MRLCQRYQIHIISDEVYGCSVFRTGDGTLPFTSLLSIDTTDLIDPDLCHVTYGFSKDFGAPGLRLGAIITRSKQVHKAIRSVMRFYNPSGVSVAIGLAMLEDQEWCRNFLDNSKAKIYAAYTHVTTGLDQLGIKYLPAYAGFFVYIDLSPYLPDLPGASRQRKEFALAERLVQAGVFLHPGEEHCSQVGWFRMVYTQKPAVVTEGLRRYSAKKKN
jgi:1-aminocyclopropane-1-carboxylate synthase